MVGSSVRLGRRFWLLATARTVSVAGNGFGRVALAFGVLTLPGASPATLSLVLACQAVPQLVLVLFGGVLADRYSRARLLVTAEGIAAAAWLGLVLAVLGHDQTLWHICVLAALGGAATALLSPALNGVMPQLVSAEQLQHANGTLRVGQNVALLAGLGLSGVAVATLGPAIALLLNAGSFLISGALIVLIRVLDPPSRGTSVVADLRAGGREFFSRQWLWVVVAQYAFVVAAINATVGVLGPMRYAHQSGGAAAWGWIVAAQAVGTIAGAGLATRVRPRHPIRVAVLVTFVFAAPMLLLATGAPVWACAAAMFVSGITNDVFGVLWQTTIQTHVPADALSRVSAYDSFGSLAFAPLGLAAAGPLAATIGIPATFVVCAVIVIAATSAALVAPQVRSLRTTST